MLQNGEIVMELSNNTKPNCFEIYFENYDYTIGNIINYEMYNTFFNSGEINSVSIKKLHPHDKHITMEVSVVSNTNPQENLIRMLTESCKTARQNIDAIKSEMKKMSMNDNEE